MHCRVLHATCRVHANVMAFTLSLANSASISTTALGRTPRVAVARWRVLLLLPMRVHVSAVNRGGLGACCCSGRSSGDGGVAGARGFELAGGGGEHVEEGADLVLQRRGRLLLLLKLLLHHL